MVFLVRFKTSQSPGQKLTSPSKEPKIENFSSIVATQELLCFHIFSGNEAQRMSIYAPPPPPPVSPSMYDVNRRSVRKVLFHLKCKSQCFQISMGFIFESIIFISTSSYHIPCHPPINHANHFKFVRNL